MSTGLSAATLGAHWGFAPSAHGNGHYHGVSAGLWHFRSSDPIPLDAKPDPAVHMITPFLAGSVRHELVLDGRKRYQSRVKPGMFNLVRAGETPVSLVQEADFTCMLIFLPDAVLRDYVAGERNGNSEGIELLPIGAEADGEITRIARALAPELRVTRPGGSLIVDGLTLQLAGHLVRRWSNLSLDPRFTRPPSIQGLANWQVGRVIDQLIASLADEPTLDALAVSVGLSACHFARAFKASTGVPPHRYLVQLRIESAQKLLETTTLPIADIAAQVGYDDPSYFARLFRKQLGITPAAYRSERRS